MACSIRGPRGPVQRDAVRPLRDRMLDCTPPERSDPPCGGMIPVAPPGMPIVRGLSDPERRVDLVPLLERVRSLETLSGVVAALGHEPLLEAAPGVAGRPGADGDGAALVVGRAGAFPWFAVAGPEPERLARRVARRLAARGRLGGVLAFDSAGRRLGVAVAFDGAAIARGRPRPAGRRRARLPASAGGRGPGRRPGLCRARRRCAERRGRRPPLLPRVQGDAGPNGRGTSHAAPRRGAAEPGAAAAHPRPLPLLHPVQGLARGPRPVPVRGGGPLPRAPAADPPRSPAPALLRHAQPTGGGAEPDRRRIRRDSVSQRRPVRAASARALASGRHTESHLARCVRPAVRAVPLRRLGRRPGRWHRARHARPRLRGRHGAVRAARVGQLLHPGAIGSVDARRRARRTRGRAARLLRGGGGAAADRPRSRRRRAARRSHRARSRGRLGRVPAGRARTAVLARGARRCRLRAGPPPHPSAHALRRRPQRRRGAAHGAPALAGRDRPGSGGSARAGGAAAQPRLPHSPGRHPVRAGRRTGTAARPRCGPGQGRRGSPAAARHGQRTAQARAGARAPRGGVPGRGGFAAGRRVGGAGPRRGMPARGAKRGPLRRAPGRRRRDPRPPRRQPGRAPSPSGGAPHAGPRARGAVVPLSEPFRRRIRRRRLRHRGGESARGFAPKRCRRRCAGGWRAAIAGGEARGADSATGRTWPSRFSSARWSSPRPAASSRCWFPPSSPPRATGPRPATRSRRRRP